MNNTAMMSEAGMAERRWMKWGLVFLCWLGAGVFFAGSNVVASISRRCSDLDSLRYAFCDLDFF